VTQQSHAVFLSYASQDQEAAARICDALRAAGIEVWFDQSELRGGDAWDQSIRKQIKTCALLIPIISKHTHERAEGYFRLEWKLAVDRSHLIMANKAFIVPVVIDNTADDDENVPEKFREVQWTRLPAGVTPPEFVTRIQQLLSGESGNSLTLTRSSGTLPSSRVWRLKPAWPAAAVVVAGLATYLLAEKPWTVKLAAPSKPVTSAETPVAFNPPPHSIAVLPFVNMSGDKEQEYFSDGLTEEVLNSLAEINELQVAARTSAFSFKGKDTDIGTIARKLNVGAVLEGSVRRSGNTVRITTQLINAVTGFHLWSHTYDRDLTDVLKLQADIAEAVASALKVNLLSDVATKIELGGTRNPAAFDAYLRGRKAGQRDEVKDSQDAIAAYTEATRLDPNYALAFAGRSLAYSRYATEFAAGAAIRENFDKGLAVAQQALALAPELAEGHLALAYFFERTLDFGQASKAYDRARVLEPGNADVLSLSGRFAAWMGRIEPGLAAVRRAVTLDPLNARSHVVLGTALYLSRRYREAVAATTDAISLDPDYQSAYADRGLAYYGLGDLERARASCEVKPDWQSQQCLAVAYDKLGRHADAEAVLANMKAANGDDAAYQYAEIYAQWGDTSKALEWLDTAVRVRDPGLANLKTDPLMDPLRQEPRFQAVIRELKFPQ
jgi:TolB-like protein/cytochrome c-type biogenesis protein CcmH/NrfG